MSSTHPTILSSIFTLIFLTTSYTANNIQLSCRQVMPWTWPQGMSYEAWQNFLRSHLWFIGSNVHVRSHRRKKNKKLSRRYRMYLREKERRRNQSVQQQTYAIINQISRQSPTDRSEGRSSTTLPSPEDPLCDRQIETTNGNVKLELITMLKQFCERKHVLQHIEETIPDRRNPEFITYSKQSILMSALAIFLFRMQSGNKFDEKSHDEDEKYSKTNMAKFIGAPEDRVPVIKTIEKFLKNLAENSVNDLLIVFFQDLLKSKFFKQHPQIMPGDFFLLAADCVHTHTYNHPHHADREGNNNCECCLKRIYNKGAENEKIRWLHNTLVLSFVFMGGLKIPVYRYPIHAKQVVNLESASEENHKQECELVALKAALPVIRHAFPRMKIVLLLDGLYANRPVIQLTQKQKCGYIIVRKDACLTSLAKECDEQSVHLNHKKNCVKKTRRFYESWLIEEKYEWFNSKYLGDEVTTNVLRFLETKTKEGEETKIYKCEWLFSWRLSSKTCELAARQGRARWEIEDLFNSLKNRGYELKHDYSRDPRSCFNWQGLALLAFGIFELFRFSETVKQRGNLSQIALAEKLEGQLLHRPTEEIFSKKQLLKRIQFRYHFVVDLIPSKKVSSEESEKALETG